MKIKMIVQTCAICEKNNYKVLYPENFDLKKIDERVFSARRLPDKIHYRIVKCNRCGLVYSNPILPYSKIVALYRKSFTSYEEHIENLKETYGYYLKKLSEHSDSKIENLKLLEIGCGNGFFLEEAIKQGYKKVYGVEPGKKSVEKASAKIKKNIVVDIFRPGLFKKNFFDVVCCFQTLDHIPDPNNFLKECYAVLKKGGLVLFLNHDASSFSAKLLGERSPIIDIEHTYLYDKKTMPRLFKKHKFKILQIKNASNVHSLGHLVYLFPFSKILKENILKILSMFKLDKIKLKLALGNIVLIAKK